MNKDIYKKFLTEKVVVLCRVRFEKALTIPGETILTGEECGKRFGMVNVDRMLDKHQLVREKDPIAKKLIKAVKDREARLAAKVKKFTPKEDSLNSI